MAIGTSFDIEPARLSDNDENLFSLTLSGAQLAALMNTINWNVDMDTVALDNGNPDRAEFLVAFAEKASRYL